MAGLSRESLVDWTIEHEIEEEGSGHNRHSLGRVSTAGISETVQSKAAAQGKVHVQVYAYDAL